MASLTELLNYTDQLLNVGDYQDYCPNGLQVEGRAEVGRIISGVTASQALIDTAVAEQADLLLVHHGWFWKGEAQPVVGMKRRRLLPLLTNDISLVAYHLPLDGHGELGNNAQLAKRLDLVIDERFGPGPDGGIAFAGRCQEPESVAGLAEHLTTILGRPPVVISGGEHPIRRIGWCSGGAQGYLQQAAELGLDAFISGELSEPTVHIARELGIHYFAAGHHATERYGVQALGEHLAQRFGLQHRFIDIDSPA